MRDWYGLLETACMKHMEAYKKYGGRHHDTKLWKDRIEWVETKVLLQQVKQDARKLSKEVK